MPFSAGKVAPVVGHLDSALTTPQAGFPGRVTQTWTPKGVLNDANINVKNTGENMGNPYGIPGSQGPAINIARVIRAIMGREAPVIVTIDRRVDPQYSNQDLGASVHGRQEPIPGKQDNTSDMIVLNTWNLPGRGNINDPESLSRDRKGASRLAGGQTEGVGMQDTTRSSQLINESPAPSRIPRFWNDGLNAAAGLNQYAFTQQNYRAFLKHPWLGRVPQATRGIRSISGVTGQFSTASNIRIPAIYVPSAVG